MHKHDNQIACMPGVLLIDAEEYGYFTQCELLYELLKSLCFNPKKARGVRHKIVTIRTVDRIMDGLVMQGT